MPPSFFFTAEPALGDDNILPMSSCRDLASGKNAGLGSRSILAGRPKSDMFTFFFDC